MRLRMEHFVRDHMRLQFSVKSPCPSVLSVSPPMTPN